MRRALIGGVALLAVVAAGCKRIDQTTPTPGATPTQTPAIKSIYALNSCPPIEDGDIKATVNLIIPDKLDGKKIDRKVNFGPPIPADDPDTGEKPNGPFKPNKPNAAEPFDVFLSEVPVLDDTSGYIQVRILLRQKENWSFWNSGAIHGVGTNSSTDDTLCGGGAEIPGKNPGQDGARDIVIFYVKIQEMKAKPAGYVVPFTIGLQAGDNASGAPILIDPMIRNDGGCCRMQINR